VRAKVIVNDIASCITLDDNELFLWLLLKVGLDDSSPLGWREILSTGNSEARFLSHVTVVGNLYNFKVRCRYRLYISLELSILVDGHQAKD